MTLLTIGSNKSIDMDSLTTDNISPSHPNSINGKANEDSEELKKAEGDPSNVNDQGEDLDDADDEDDEVEENRNIDIQLGFIEENERNKLFLEFDWRDWDGGKVGGLPIWLNPSSIPQASELQCQSCNNPMCFLLQMYCPLDNVENGFHRCYYVYSCRKSSCIDSGRGMKTFRVQLPRNNEFYSHDPESEKVEKKIFPINNHCALCGCKAANTCSNCKVVQYCSKAHQKQHWKHHKKQCLNWKENPESRPKQFPYDPLNLDESQKSSLFPEYSIVVDIEEIPSLEMTNADPNAEKTVKSLEKEGKIWEDAVTEGGADEEQDAKLTQKDYNKALSEQIHDPVYIQFLTKIDQTGKDQIIRYCESSIHRKSVAEREKLGIQDLDTALPTSVRDHGKLFTSTEMKKQQIEIPSCPYCHGPRAFEFQIMPQLLYYLKVDKNTQVETKPKEGITTDISTPTEGEEKQEPQIQYLLSNKNEEDINWGVIDIYSCINSCSTKTNELSSCYEEYMHFQTIPEK